MAEEEVKKEDVQQAPPEAEKPAEEPETQETPVAETVEESVKADKEEKVEEKEEKKPKKVKEPERQDMTTLHERTIAAMSYFGFLAVIPFYLKKDSEFCRFHGKQGLLLAIIFFIAKLFTVIDLIMDIVLILQIFVMFRMGFAALSGRWKKMLFFYDWSCELEEALTLKTKEEELEEVTLKPNEIKEEETEEEPKK
jgi:uncharacterized membrane protein